MTNIVPIDKARGFTRMDNQLMESLAAVDLPARELRLVLAIARQTIGYQVETRRLRADELGKLTNMRRDVTSKALSHLLERRIIYRVGGSRGEIGISPSAEWVFFEEKTSNLTETKTPHTDKVVSLRKNTSETKTATSLLYGKKETPYVNLPSEDITCPPKVSAQADPEPTTKSDRKAPFGLTHLLADNPHQVPEQLLADWLTQRKAKRAAVTATVWATVNAELAKCVDAGISAADAITEAVSAGWQGFKASWVINRAQDNRRQAPSAKSNHHGFAGRDYTDGLIPREDGSYAF